MGNKYILATDPRGFQVEFSEERWLRLITKHPDLETGKIIENDLKETIEKPRDGFIYQSKRYENCSLYYHKPIGKYEILVVVRYINQFGEIITVHYCSKREKGEKIIWPDLKIDRTE